MKKGKRKGTVWIAAAALLFLIAGIVRYMPSTKKMNALEYFGMSNKEEIALVVNDVILCSSVHEEGGTTYISCAGIHDNLSRAFYWDEDTQSVIVTTDDKIRVISPSEQGEVIVFNQTPMLAVSLIEEVLDVTVAAFEEPNRIVITDSQKSNQLATLSAPASVRYRGGIKSAIITKVASGTEVIVENQMENWTKIRTADGYTGYVQNKYLKILQDQKDSETLETTKSEKENVVLGWDMISYEGDMGEIQTTQVENANVNVVSPTWYALSGAEGEINSWASLDYVQAAKKQKKEVWALLDNFSMECDTAKILKSHDVREKIIQFLMKESEKYELQGINVDIENLPENSGDDYIQFLRELAVYCRQFDLKLSVDVPVPYAYNDYYQFAEIGKVSDYVIMMGYDEHYSASKEAGSVASLSFEEDGIQRMSEMVDTGQIISGIPFYTRLWVLGADGSLKKNEVLGMTQAQQLIEKNQAQTKWDETTQQDLAVWTDEEGQTYKIWMENEDSIAKKVELVSHYQLAGLACWRLGLEKDSVWNTISETLK